MRSLWSGAISLSLINIPVKLGSTSKDSSLGLKMVRMSDGSPIKFVRTAELDGKEVPWDQIGKGYTAPDGSLVILSDKEVKDAYGDKNRIAEVIMATDASNIPPLAIKSSYWVHCDKGGEKSYALIAGALRQSGKVLVVKFALRDRVNVAVLRAHDGYLALESLEWDADLIRPDFAAPAQTATEDEQALALKLIEAVTHKFDHAAETDKSSEQVMAVIDAKIKTGQVIAPPARPDNVGTPVNLADQLMAAVEAQKQPGNTSVPKQVTTRHAASVAKKQQVSRASRAS